MAAVLGSPTTVPLGLGQDEKVGPFFANSATPITALQLTQIQEFVERVAATADLEPLLPCAEEAGDTECAKEFVRTIGARAFRRPLSKEEENDYVGLLEFGADGAGFSHGARLVLGALLQSPHFLYHVEVGPTDPDPSTTLVSLGAFEVAARLSYLLWNSAPDEALLEKASNGSLLDPAELEAEFERMLADPRGRAGVAAFHREWLELDRLKELPKDPGVFPEYSSALANAMIDEVETFADQVLRGGDGSLRTLLTGTNTWIAPSMAKLYGDDLASYDQSTGEARLDGSRRAGLLTMPGFLAAHAHPDQTSPVHRGLAIRREFLCQELPDPPPEVDDVPPSVNTTETTRERFDAHSEDPSCAGCHRYMDPVGLGFERYDGIGRYRTEENGQEVDASGELVPFDENDPDELTGTFEGAPELAELLAESPRFGSCLAEQWFRFTLGRSPTKEDFCAWHALSKDLRDGEGDVRHMLRRFILSRSFLTIRSAGAPLP